MDECSWLKGTFLASLMALISLAFTTFNDSLAVIVDHYENGQREIYDTEDPGADGCESPTLICNVPPPSLGTNNASGSNATDQTKASGDEYFLKGNQLLNEGRNEEALAAFELSISIEPGSGAYYNKGLALYNLGRYEQALAAFDSAIGMDATDADGHYMKGLILFELERYEDALVEYDKALLIKPAADHYIEKAWTLAYLGRNEDAVTASNKAVLMEPNADSYLAKAGILNMTGRTEEALVAMDKFNQLNKTE